MSHQRAGCPIPAEKRCASCLAGLIILVLFAPARAAQGAGTPVLMYDGWTGELSIRANGDAIDSLIVTCDPGMFAPAAAIFPQGTVDNSITPERLATSAGNGPLGDSDFGPILPTGLEARVVQADVRGFVRPTGSTSWDGIVVDLGNGLDPGGSGSINSGSDAIPEPSAIASLTLLGLLPRRRRR